MSPAPPQHLRLQDTAPPVRADFTLRAVTAAHGGTYRCYSSQSAAPHLLSLPSDPLELLVSGEGQPRSCVLRGRPGPCPQGSSGLSGSGGSQRGGSTLRGRQGAALPFPSSPSSRASRPAPGDGAELKRPRGRPAGLKASAPWAPPPSGLQSSWPLAWREHKRAASRARGPHGGERTGPGSAGVPGDRGAPGAETWMKGGGHAEGDAGPSWGRAAPVLTPRSSEDQLLSPRREAPRAVSEGGGGGSMVARAVTP